MGEVILTMKGIDKSFPGVHALDHVDLEVRKGEVLALMGENGAGKSTLMKVLTGIYKKDSGTITYEGKEVEFANTREAQDNGIVIVHQELNMLGHLTVAQNIFIGREFKKGIRIDDKKMNEEAKKLFDRMHIDIDPRETMNKLTVGKQQMCEIAKAISHDAKVIIFDEPSAALTETEIQEMFKIINDLKAKGIGIIYISHRMDEIKVITDRVTVMRDGTYVGTLITKDCTKDDIINMMVGRVIYEDPKTQNMVPKDAPVVLKVDHLNAGKMVKDVSFELHKGEILGFSGLMGAGRTETARALFGADPIDSGDIYINGKKVDIKSPEDAVRNGIGYLSEDRKRYGIVVQKSVAENTSMATMEHFMKGIFIDKKKEKEVSQQYVESLATKTPNVDQLVVNLSGGNQQKVVIAKWLTRNCDILIFDEPTRGIDVGAKNEIYKLMNQLAEQGKAIIMISSEMTEILRMSDRIVVMCVCAMSPGFRKYTTFVSILDYSYYIALMAIGVAFPLMTGGVDLSIGTGLICYSLVGGYLIVHQGWPTAAGMLVSILMGVAIGVLNGVLVAIMDLPAFLATLCTSMIARGIGTIVVGGFGIPWPVAGSPEGWFRNIFKIKTDGMNIPIGFLWIILLVILMTFVLNHTRIGRYTLAIGSNKEATRLSGVNVKFYHIMAYVICGFFAGLAAISYSAIFATVQPGSGAGFELEAIGGAIIGGVSMTGGVGSITGTLAGVFVICLLKTGLPFIGLTANWQQIITGFVLIAAVLIDIFKRKKEAA